VKRIAFAAGVAAVLVVGAALAGPLQDCLTACGTHHPCTKDFKHCLKDAKDGTARKACMAARRICERDRAQCVRACRTAKPSLH
jgi:hypothetical protein